MMTFDDIIRPQNPAQPTVTRIPAKPEPEPPPQKARVDDHYAPADTEPHFPRIFPGI